jgi:hypothetical protein
MKRGQWTPLLAGVLPIAALGTHALQGCYSAVPNDGLIDAGPPKKIEAGPLADGSVGPGAACGTTVNDSTHVWTGAPGVVPPPTCHLYTGASMSCTAATSACKVGTSCGTSSCLPTADNTAAGVSGKGVYNFRMESLYIVYPTVLQSTLIQTETITSSVTLNAPQCGYGAVLTSVLGAFNWIVSVDKSTGMVTTGGAPPVMDPYSDGYCFVDSTFTPDGGTSTKVAPTTVAATFKGNTFSTNPQPKGQVLNIPTFQGPTMLKDPIILPISAARFSDVSISPDGNCIGDINPQWYGSASTCADQNLSTCPKWFTNGALAGYITLAAADTVYVELLMGSLCTLLVGKAGAEAHCTATEMMTGGDYCSTSADGTGCNDSVWLAATFAANAVQVAPGGSPLCGAGK